MTKKLEPAKAVPYMIAQVVGGIVGAGLLALILSGTNGYLDLAQNAGFASNGYGAHSPAGFDLMSVAIIEIVVTAVFVLIVLGTTDESGVPKGFGPIAAGFGLALVHMVSIPVSNTSVNPARSIATAVFQGDWALGQVWAFIVFPLIGAVRRRRDLDGGRPAETVVAARPRPPSHAPSVTDDRTHRGQRPRDPTSFGSDFLGPGIFGARCRSSSVTT